MSADTLFYLVVTGLSLAGSLYGAAHALLNSRDPRSAAAWVAICVFLPIAGLLLYLAFGKNRIRTRAKRLHSPSDSAMAGERLAMESADAEHLIAPEYRNLAYLGRATSGNPLLAGNAVGPLLNGDEAYPAMLEAIRGARRFVHLASYIFDARGVGAEFVQALGDAHARGVEVRVMLDAFGELYGLPRAGAALEEAGVEFLRFLPLRLFPPTLGFNLRNHRKILVIDGNLAFTGGMNIRSKHLSRPDGRPPKVLDVHFCVQGPVVAQIDAVFRADWAFSGGAVPASALLQPAPAGDAECRVIVDGPNEDLDKLLWVLVGAISLARSSIKIMTPYFLPPRELTVALQTAALRGVEVTVILPATNNFAFMNWAATHALGDLLEAGVRVAFFEGPFVHTKFFLVDDYYAHASSSNLDPRSLRLNFEMAVEVYDQDMGQHLAAHFNASLARSRIYTLADWRRRRLPARLRDAAFWVFSPYL
jgi:cardiolipin synthase